MSSPASDSAPTPVRRVISVGVDVGQTVDPTAIAVMEAHGTRDEARGRWEWTWKDRYLRRLPLGTPYPVVVERIAELCRRLDSRLGDGVQRQAIWVDATGVGQPIVDALRAAGVQCIACYFTPGARRRPLDHGVSLGKEYLVSRVQSLMQHGRLHLSALGKEAEGLRRELQVYQIKVSATTSTATFGAMGKGQHDDMVTAVGLAVQSDPVVPFLV